MRNKILNRRLLPFAIAAAVVVADQLTKAWAEASFAGEELTVIPGLLWFTFTENTGAAFSLFRGAGPLLGILAIGVAAFIVLGLRNHRPTHEVVGLGLVLGGALGNLWDRALRGSGFMDGPVVDWIRVPNFPTFNIADSAITVGVVILLIGGLRARD